MKIIESLRKVEKQIFEQRDESHDLVGAYLTEDIDKDKLWEMLNNNDIDGIINLLEEQECVGCEDRIDSSVSQNDLSEISENELNVIKKFLNLNDGYLSKENDEFHIVYNEYDDEFFKSLKDILYSIIYDDNYNLIVEEGLDESVPMTDIATVGIFGDEVDGFNSVDELVKFFEGEGIEVSGVEGDMNFGWEMNLTGNPEKMFAVVCNIIPDYHCSTAQEFLNMYSIDEFDIDESINGLGTITPSQLAKIESRRDALWHKEDAGTITDKEQKELDELTKQIEGHYSKKKELMAKNESLTEATDFKNFIYDNLLDVVDNAEPKLITNYMIKCSKSAIPNALYYVNKGENVVLRLGNMDTPVKGSVSHVWVEHNGKIAQTFGSNVSQKFIDAYATKDKLHPYISIALVPGDVEASREKIKDKLSKITNSGTTSVQAQSAWKNTADKIFNRKNESLNEGRNNDILDIFYEIVANSDDPETDVKKWVDAHIEEDPRIEDAYDEWCDMEPY